MSIPRDTPRVLSIQSSVVHGYVGNKCATFPLQLHGLDVDPINSVQFSNHTGYTSFTGQKVSGDELLQLIEGLKNNSLVDYQYVITGYMGSVSFLKASIGTIEQMVRNNKHTIFSIPSCIFADLLSL